MMVGMGLNMLDTIIAAKSLMIMYIYMYDKYSLDMLTSFTS